MARHLIHHIRHEDHKQLLSTIDELVSKNLWEYLAGEHQRLMYFRVMGTMVNSNARDLQPLHKPAADLAIDYCEPSVKHATFG